MSVATEISRLQTAKADIKTAIEAKGVEVPSSAKIDTYDDYITAIPSGASDGYIDNAGVEYVDLGLPSGTLWAKKNVGAATETDAGDEFCWGRISTSNNTGINEYWPNLVNRKLYDAVTASGGEPCCIMSDTGQELRQNTTCSVVENYNGSGKAVVKLTSKTDSTKFITFPVMSENPDYYGYHIYSCGNIWTTYLYGQENSGNPRRFVIFSISISAQIENRTGQTHFNMTTNTCYIEADGNNKFYCRGIIRR